jgi:hypothetical protein
MATIVANEASSRARPLEMAARDAGKGQLAIDRAV